MASESTHEQDRRFVAGVAFSRTVQEAIDRVLTRPHRTRPLQTGELLAALAEADTDGDWVRVWPSYEGGADALLAAAGDTRHQPSGHSWRGVPLSQDLLAALRLLTAMARRYEMDPVQPGAVVLALAADPGTAAAQYLGRLSGCDHAELLDRIQSDLVGVTLEGFDELTERQPGSPEGAPGLGQAPRWQVLIRWIAALYCLWVAWLALRAGAGSVIAVGIGVVAVIISMMAALASVFSMPSAGWDPRNWEIKWRPQYTKGWFILGLGTAALFGFLILTLRHRHPGLTLPNLVLLGIGLTILLWQGSFSVGSRRPAASQPAGSTSGSLHYQALFEAPLFLAAGIGLLAWYARLGLISLRLPVFQVPWQARVLAWIRRSFTSAYLGRFFEHSYWPLLVMAAAFAGCYFCALGVQLVMTRVTRRAIVFAAGSAAAGLVIVAFSYAGLPSAPRSGTLPVVSCPTSLGIAHPAVQLPRSRLAAVPQALAADLSVYADNQGVMELLGPKGWSCTAAIGADGSGGVTVYPAGAGPLSSVAITGSETSACVGCTLAQACALFPGAATALRSAIGEACPARPPAAETVAAIAAGIVAFEDPPGVKGDGRPSGGQYPANGVMTYHPSAQDGSWQETCTLPASEKDVCTAVLNTFVSWYGQR